MVQIRPWNSRGTFVTIDPNPTEQKSSLRFVWKGGVEEIPAVLLY